MPRFARTTIAALALSLVVGCGDDDGPTNPNDGVVVRGVVRDASDGSRIKKAKVTFRSDALDEESGRTNDDGEFSIISSSRSEHGRLEASKTGFNTTVVSVYLGDGEVIVDLDLEPK